MAVGLRAGDEPFRVQRRVSIGTVQGGSGQRIKDIASLVNQVFTAA